MAGGVLLQAYNPRGASYYGQVHRPYQQAYYPTQEVAFRAHNQPQESNSIKRRKVRAKKQEQVTKFPPLPRATLGSRGSERVANSPVSRSCSSAKLPPIQNVSIIKFSDESIQLPKEIKHQFLSLRPHLRGLYVQVVNNPDKRYQAYATLLKSVFWELASSGREGWAGGSGLHVFDGGRVTHTFSSSDLKRFEQQILGDGPQIVRSKKAKGAEIASGGNGMVMETLDVNRLLNKLGKIRSVGQTNRTAMEVVSAIHGSLVAEKVAIRGSKAAVPKRIRVVLKGCPSVMLPLDQKKGGSVFELGNRNLHDYKMSNREAKIAAVKLAKGLGESHRRGVILRDIKPLNMMRMDSRNPEDVAFIDIDEAIDEDESDLFLRVGMYDYSGTGRYLAPELLFQDDGTGGEGKECFPVAIYRPSRSADIYAFGISLCEIFGIEVDSYLTNYVESRKEYVQSANTTSMMNKIQRHPGLSHYQKQVLMSMVTMNANQRLSDLRHVEVAFDETGRTRLYDEQDSTML